MKSEQAEGKPTDKRSDVWSFGVVLYEMLSGKRCFGGKTTSHVLVHILEQEPDWQALPTSVPSGARSLLERCLTKDPAERLRDIGDMRTSAGVGKGSTVGVEGQPGDPPFEAAVCKRSASEMGSLGRRGGASVRHCALRVPESVIAGIPERARLRESRTNQPVEQTHAQGCALA